MEYRGEIYWTVNTPEVRRQLTEKSNTRNHVNLTGPFLIMQSSGLVWTDSPYHCIILGYRSRTPDEFVSIAAERWPKEKEVKTQVIAERIEEIEAELAELRRSL